MTPRDRVIRTLNRQPSDRAPRDLWLLPGIETDRADELAELGVRFPCDILQVENQSPPPKKGKGGSSRAGHWTDAWGCAWQLGPHGPGPLVQSPLTDDEKLAAFEPPAETLDQARFARADKACEATNRFVLASSEVRPLDRLLGLRGPETALAELAGGNKDIRRLLGKVHDHFCREMELWGAGAVDGIVFCDELASAEGLRLPGKLWRNLFKPLYRRYCEILHAHDKFVFFRSEGPIADLFGDLVEVGIDAIHCPLFSMDFEKLAEKFRGRVTFWGGIGPQQLDPPGTPAQVREAVRRVRRALDFGSGGVIAQCQWAAATPLRNLTAFFEEWIVPLRAGA